MKLLLDLVLGFINTLPIISRIAFLTPPKHRSAAITAAMNTGRWRQVYKILGDQDSHTALKKQNIRRARLAQL